MLAAQLPRQERLRCADDVITNDGSLEQASADVRRLHGRYLDLARERAKARE
jgi:dephospho-CoA kinase